MSDIRSINTSGNSAPGAEYIEKVRKAAGEGFSDKPVGKNKRNEMGKDDFMKLMSAQLKNQDPISPMKNEQMAAQLAQFSSLEQMFNVNQNLEKMTANQRPQEGVLAASLIGKQVVIDGSRLHLEKDKPVEIKFELPAAAAQGSVAVVDAKGTVVRELPLGSVPKGPQSFRWDGKSDKGISQDAGEYTFRVTAVDAEEKAIRPVLSDSGLVTGVSFEGGKTLLLVGDKKMTLDSISRIEDLSAQAAAKTKKEPVSKSGMPVAQEAGANKLAPSDLAMTGGAQKDLQSVEPQSKIENKNYLANETDPSASLKQGEDTESVESPLAMKDPLWNPNQ